MHTKIVTPQKYEVLREEFKKESKRVIHCHGVYDLIHPGHIIHLKEAKSLGDILIVTITSAPYVQKGPGRPYFDDDMRLMTIAALEYVDYVMLSEEITAIGVIDTIQPSFYVKGLEYSISEDDITANIDKEVLEVRKFGGDVYYTKGDVFSSTKLINTALSSMSPAMLAYSKKVTGKRSAKDIISDIENFTDIKIAVIGDIIIDEYVYCELQGLMSKDQALSTKYIGKHQYMGGSLAIARHLSNFSENVSITAMIGTDPVIHSSVLSAMSNKTFLDLDFNKAYKTVVKTKYITKNGMREEYNKLFSTNYIQTHEQQKLIDRNSFYKKVEAVVKSKDLVVVCDYGHGLIDDKVMQIINDNSKYIALNCQTNSSNYGINLITKYSKANIFTLDEKELKLASAHELDEIEMSLNSIKSKLNAEDAFLTIGSKGAIGIDKDGIIANCPALTLTVKDTIGAGDAFFAMALLASYCGFDINVTTLLGNAAGAIISNVLGNSETLSKVKLLKYVSTVLNV